MLRTTALFVHTGPSHPTSGLRCEHYVWDADIMEESGICDNDRCERHPQRNILNAGIAAAEWPQRVLWWLV